MRPWVRVPTEGFLHVTRWPLLAFLLLVAYAAFFFARGSVEASVRERVRSRLAEQWLDFATVEVSGQDVLLRGAPPAAGDADRALLLAERTACPTVLGSLDCTLDVRAEFEAAKPAPAAARPAGEMADACDRELAELLSGSSIEFERSAAEIAPASRPLLDKLAAVASGCPGRLRVEGHTDDRGSEKSNLRLSRERAESVCQALFELGVPRERLVAEGFGEARPIAPNTTAEGRARNRRIEIRMMRE